MVWSALIYRLIPVAAVLLAIAVCAAPPPARSQATPVPVMVGGEPEQDACGIIGVVAGLKPVAGNTLSVRAGPGREFEALDELALGTQVWVCDHQAGWLGIVYGSAETDCGVSSPAAARRAYGGPCRSGWVFEQYIAPLAG